MPSEYLSVKTNKMILPDVGKITVCSDAPARPGQFYMLRPKYSRRLLGRAISLCDQRENILTFLYKVVGDGTAELARLHPGDLLRVTGPLGNGFPLGEISGKVALVGGGVGVAPLLYTARVLQQEGIPADAYLGYPDAPYLHKEIAAFCENVRIATESGFAGTRGYVTDILDPAEYGGVFCCGPLPMMRAVVRVCENAETPVWVSLENKMACGVGACLVCTCTDKSGENLRTCKDGPVFRGEVLNFDA